MRTLAPTSIQASRNLAHEYRGVGLFVQGVDKPVLVERNPPLTTSQETDQVEVGRPVTFGCEIRVVVNDLAIGKGALES